MASEYEATPALLALLSSSQLYLSVLSRMKWINIANANKKIALATSTLLGSNSNQILCM
jgi:hypothetical protein